MGSLEESLDPSNVDGDPVGFIPVNLFDLSH